MPSVNWYFQVHQPFRLKRYNFFKIGHDHEYFDDVANGEIFRKVARKSYLPTNKLILKMIEKYKGKFKVSFSISGVALEQMKMYSPETLHSFRELAKTRCVEFLAETYYHSLSSIFDEAEFKSQVQMHRELMKSELGVEPQVFRNTELVYNDWIGTKAAEMGFKAILAEGADDILQWRSPNFVYESMNPQLKLLLKNYRLSDDIAFRFSNHSWAEFPLTAPKFAHWIHRISGSGDVVNLFMDYETFGEHQWESTGIFDFFEHLPREILKHSDWDFKTPSEVLQSYPSVGPLSFWRTVSWADIDRDLTAWQGNHSQRGALKHIYEIKDKVFQLQDPKLLDIWRKLQTSDHFYYMCTKWFADGDVHAYFSPYKNPYEAFINYMNIFTDFSDHVLNHKAKVVEIGFSSQDSSGGGTKSISKIQIKSAKEKKSEKVAKKKESPSSDEDSKKSKFKINKSKGKVLKGKIVKKSKVKISKRKVLSDSSVSVSKKTKAKSLSKLGKAVKNILTPRSLNK